LTRTDRTAEAVLFAQTYLPSRAPEIVKLWKQGLEANGKAKVARLLGVPPVDGEGDADLFPEWDSHLQLEKDGGSKGNDLIDVGDDDEVEEEEEQENGKEEEEETTGEGEEAEVSPAAAAADEPASPQTETEVE
jgi:coatomer subunit beta'